MTVKAEIKGNQLIITADLETPTPSRSGKTLVVASSRGNVTTTAEVGRMEMTLTTLTNTELRKLLRLVKSGDTLSVQRAFPGLPLLESDAIYAEFARRDAIHRAKPTKRGREWHIAPDGRECCCTAEDRRYGCGCR